MAEFYVKTKHYGAAKYYYAKVVTDYPETKLAQESRTRIDQYKAEPDNPVQPFQWLVDILPQSKREGPVLPKNLASLAKKPDLPTVTNPDLPPLNTSGGPESNVANQPNPTTTTR